MKPSQALVSLVLLFSTAALAGAKHSGRSPASLTKPLPPSTVVNSDLPSAESAVTDMWVSHDYEATSPKAHPGATLTSVEEQLIREFREGTGHFKHLANVPAKNKGFVVRRYEEGDKGITNEVIKSAKEGYRLTLGIFDSNPAFKGKFKTGEKFNSDFEKATPRENRGKTVATAEMIDAMIKGGLKLNDVEHGLVMQPLYSGDMAPIMHNKDMLFLVYNNDGTIKEGELYTGSNNMTDSPRYNRMYRIVDQAAVKYVLDNCVEMAKVFAKGGQIKDIDSKPPLELKYRDGSTLELAFTDGKFNPNDRIQATLETAAKTPDKIKIKHAAFSEFVVTDSGVVEGVRSAMKAQPKMAVSGVLDDQFLDLHEYGKGAAFAGYSTTPPHGKATFGFARELRSRIDMKAYQRKVDGFTDDDPDGPPVGRHLWHDKTTVLNLEENGEDWDEVYTGSFNLSTNGANAELQMKFHMPAKASLAPMISESIDKVAAAEPEFAVPLDTGVFRHFLGQFLGQSIFDLSVEKTEKVAKALTAGKYPEAMTEMREIAKQKSTLTKRASPEAVEDRIAKLDKFLVWRAKKDPSAKGMDPQHITAAAVGIVSPDTFPGTVLQQMKSALYDSKIPDDKLEAMSKEAMKELDLKLPTARDRTGQGDEEPSVAGAVAGSKCEDVLCDEDGRMPEPHPDGAHPPLHGGM